MGDSSTTFDFSVEGPLDGSYFDYIGIFDLTNQKHIVKIQNIMDDDESVKLMHVDIDIKFSEPNKDLSLDILEYKRYKILKTMNVEDIITLGLDEEFMKLRCTFEGI